MLEITVDDTVNPQMTVFRQPVSDQGAVAADRQIYLHSGISRIVELADHLRIGNVVDLSPDVRRLAVFLILDLVIDQGDEPALHLIGRDKQLLEADLGIGSLDEVEDLLHLLDDTPG